MHSKIKKIGKLVERSSGKEETDKQYKCVIVGDGDSGKTSILLRFMNGKFRDVYVPTIFETTEAQVEMEDNSEVRLTLWDTAGQEGYERLRPLSYHGAHVVLLCYSIANPDSFANIPNWIFEVKQSLPNAPIILVGCKMDLRENPSVIEYLAKLKESPVQFEEGEALAKKYGAKFLECSSLTNENIQDIFRRAAKLAVTKNAKSKKTCSIM